MITSSHALPRYIELPLALIIIACASWLGYELFFNDDRIAFQKETILAGVVAEVSPTEHEIILRSERGTDQYLYVEPETVIMQPMAYTKPDGSIAYYRTELGLESVRTGLSAKALFRKDALGYAPILTELVLDEIAISAPPASQDPLNRSVTIVSFDGAAMLLAYTPVPGTVRETLQLTPEFIRDAQLYKVADLRRAHISHARTAATFEDLVPGRKMILEYVPVATDATVRVPRIIVETANSL